MLTTTIHVRRARLDRRSGDGGCPASSAVRQGHFLLLAIGALLGFGLRLFAQASDFPATEGPNQSWTVITDSKGANVNPARIIESHSENGNRAIDKKSSEIHRFDGNFEPYQDIERETLELDPATVRTTTRTFGRDGNGTKILVQIIEEEKHILPGGGSNVLCITSSPDVSGTLRVSRREITETKMIGNDVEETQTTVMLPSLNGGLVPVLKARESRKRVTSDSVESQKTTLLLDGAGNWQVSEIRQATTRQEGTNRTTEERVSRLDSEGKLVEVSHVVSKESESTSGKKRSVVETYSIDVPGTTRDGSLHLVERKTSTERSSSTGERATEQRVEQTNPGDPGSGLRVSVLVDGRMVPGPSGFQATRTVRLRDLNGNVGIVEADTTRSDKILTIQVQQTPAEKP